MRSAQIWIKLAKNLFCIVSPWSFAVVRSTLLSKWHTNTHEHTTHIHRVVCRSSIYAHIQSTRAHSPFGYTKQPTYQYGIFVNTIQQGNILVEQTKYTENGMCRRKYRVIDRIVVWKIIVLLKLLNTDEVVVWCILWKNAIFHSKISDNKRKSGFCFKISIKKPTKHSIRFKFNI